MNIKSWKWIHSEPNSQLMELTNTGERERWKTWDALAFSPALAIATIPTLSCFNFGWNSSSKHLACSPYKNLQIKVTTQNMSCRCTIWRNIQTALSSFKHCLLVVTVNKLSLEKLSYITLLNFGAMVFLLVTYCPFIQHTMHLWPMICRSADWLLAIKHSGLCTCIKPQKLYSGCIYSEFGYWLKTENPSS